MQLTKNKQTFDARKVEQILATENKFITDLFSVLCLPVRNTEDDEEEDGNEHSHKFKKKETTRAKSLNELQERLQAITSKKKLTYKEKLTKKSLKSKMKKKNKRDERNAQQKLLRAEKITKIDVKREADSLSQVKTAKPVFNSEGKMVFSKFDFSSLGVTKEKKHEKDPKRILKNLAKEKEKLQELEKSGEVGKVIEITEKTAWKNALAKAQGEKIKDDPVLLKKSIQRHEQKKRSSGKKWRARQENVQKKQQERQNKRNENIEKRKKEKNKKSIKKAVKKGKIIPGY